MPMPRWFARFNRRAFNKREIEKGDRPVLTHVGRSSGLTHQTPLAAFPVEDGYMFTVVYGSESDWVQNVLASGEARLRLDGSEVELTSPRLYTNDEGWSQLPADAKRPPSFLNVTEHLRMDLAA